MSAFPSKSLLAAAGLDGPTVLTAMGQLFDALTGLLGTTGTQSVALAALGAPLNSTHNLATAYTILPADRGQMLECAGTWTLGATAAATLGDGFCVGVSNTGSGTITIDPNSTETVDGVASITLGAGRSTILYCDGGKWVSIGKGAVLTVNGTAPTTAGDVTVTNITGNAGTATSVGGVTAPATKPQTAAGVGQFVGLVATYTSTVLPSGGTWAYSAVLNGAGDAGIAAGGTTLGIGGTGGGAQAVGFAWRIA